MTIQNVIDMANKVNPNAWDNDIKTEWINECEGMIQSEVLLLAADDIMKYRYLAQWKGTGITFPTAEKMELPSSHSFKAGDAVTVSGLTTYSQNNKSSKITIKKIEGNVLIFDEDTFDQTGSSGDAGNATVTFDGKDTVLIAEPPHDDVYWPYLSAMISFANGEFTRYQNEMALFNSRFTEFSRWFARVYDPAGRV